METNPYTDYTGTSNLTPINLPKYKSRLIINTNFMMSFYDPMPNRFYRFWYKLLLNWKWESVQE